MLYNIYIHAKDDYTVLCYTYMEYMMMMKVLDYFCGFHTNLDVQICG